MPLKVYREPTKKEQFAFEAEQAARAYWESKPEVDQRRLARTRALMREHMFKLGHVLDVGAGERHFPCTIAVDLVHPGCQKALFPYLNFDDEQFDGVICTDVIAELPASLHRLAISELARLLKPEGYLVCSTPLDRKTYDAKEAFLTLLKTEFRIVAQKLSYAPFLFSERVGEVLFGDGRAEHIILIGQKAKIM